MKQKTVPSKENNEQNKTPNLPKSEIKEENPNSNSPSLQSSSDKTTGIDQDSLKPTSSETKMTESPLLKPDKSYQFLDPFLEAETDKYCSEEMSLTEVTSVDLSAVSTADEAEDLNETVIEADFSDHDEAPQSTSKSDEKGEEKEIDSGIKIESKDEINLSNASEEPSRIEEPDESLQKVGQTVVEEQSKSLAVDDNLFEDSDQEIIEEAENEKEAKFEDDGDPELPAENLESAESVTEKMTEDRISSENKERQIDETTDTQSNPQIPKTDAPFLSNSSDDEDLQDSAEKELENLAQSTDDEADIHSSLAPSRETPRDNLDPSGQTHGLLVNESDHVHLFFRITYFDSKF